jgi:hypothetical protein
MSVTNIRGNAQEYFERMAGRTIDAVGVFDEELVVFLDSGDEVCLWSQGDAIAMQINERPEFDA